MSQPFAESPDSVRVRIGGPDEIVAAIPHLLGFHPRESVVVIGLRGKRGRICLSMRVDLPPPERDADLAALLAAHLRQARATAVIGVIITDAPDAAEPVGVASAAADASGRAGVAGLPRRALAEALRAEFARRRLGLRDLICVRHERWWSYVCGQEECCPPEGRPIRPEAAGALAAASVAEGRVVHADRDELVRTLAPVITGAEAAALRRRLDALQERRREPLATAEGQRAAVAELEGVVRSWVERPGGLGVSEAVRYGVALARLEVRDGCMCWLAGPLADAAEALWLALVRAAVPPYTAAPATLLALYAYARGDGTLARICVERALADDPAYPMAVLVGEALDRGLPPAAIRELAACLEPTEGDR